MNGNKYSIGQSFALPPEKKKKRKISKGEARLEEVVLSIMNGFVFLCQCLVVESSKAHQNGVPTDLLI